MLRTAIAKGIPTEIRQNTTKNTRPIGESDHPTRLGGIR
jgi:hypothetical protein